MPVRSWLPRNKMLATYPFAVKHVFRFCVFSVGEIMAKHNLPRVSTFETLCKFKAGFWIEISEVKSRRGSKENISIE